MSLDDLIARLEKDADARVAAVEERAKEEVEALEAEAAAASSRVKDAALAKRRSVRRAALDAETAQARQAAMRLRLKARHALVDRVLARACSLAEEGDAERAVCAVVASRLEAALRFMGARKAIVRCRPSVAAALGAARDQIATIEVAVDAPLGIVVTSSDGIVEVDDTLRARLERLRPVIAIDTVLEVDR